MNGLSCWLLRVVPPGISRRESRKIGDSSTDCGIAAMSNAPRRRIAPALALSLPINYHCPLNIRAVTRVQATFFALSISYSGSR